MQKKRHIHLQKRSGKGIFRVCFRIRIRLGVFFLKMPSKRHREAAAEKLFVVSLGCPKNLVNTEMVTGAFLASGAALTLDPDEATCYFINTCAFLAAAREEAAEAVAEGCAWKERHPAGRLIVGGCLVSHPDSKLWKKRFPQVDLWAGPNELGKIAPLPECPSGVPVRFLLTRPHVAYLKIADGCDNCCAYCMIPKLRGRKRSRSIESCVAEARQLIEGGGKELILIAQDTTAFGEKGETLAQLLGELEKLKGDFRYRILYTHPAHYTPELIAALGRAKKFIPALDIPLQHISGRLLKAMNRHTTPEEIRELIEKLRESIPGLALRTTFITGFPGETEADFRELLDFTAEVRFERLGVFPFSPEPGTPAARMKQQVPRETAESRAKELMRRQHIRTALRSRVLVGTEMTVMLDSVCNGCAAARSDADAPEIDQLVFIPFKRKFPYRPGDRIAVRIVSALPGGDLEAELK